MRIGIYDPYLDTIGGGERYCLTLAEDLSRNHQVEIFWDKDNLKEEIKKRLLINLDKVSLVSNIFSRRGNFLEKINKTRQYDLIFYLSDGSIPLTFAKKNILHFQVPFSKISGKTLVNKIKLSRFTNIICNSSFTKNVIDRSYGVNSRVIYPPVDVANFTVSKKENIILSVGRFTGLFGGKKQEAMIDVFKKIVDSGLKNWEFVLIGGLLENDQDYFRKLDGQVAGYPIKLLPNLPFDELRKYYGRTAIYWHANGFGEDEKVNPQRFEHFGISTVEAMASGCVPIVFNGGGQKEIVEEGINGFLWETEENLINLTLELINDLKLREKMSQEATLRSKLFSKEVFLRRFNEIIGL